MRTPRELVAIAVIASLATGCQAKNQPHTIPTSPTTAIGNGIVDLPADEIVDRMAQAFDNATSVRVVAEMTDGDMTLRFDLRQRNRADGTCTMTEDGLAIEMIRVASDVYVKADDQVWRNMAPFGDRAESYLPELHGRYLKADASAEALRAMTSCLGFLDMNSRSIADIQTVEKHETTTVNGVPVIRMVELEPGPSTFYVATVGEPYPIRLEGEGGGLDFSEYNQPVEVAAPPATDVVELSSLA